jgi:hypothetical protein
MLKNITTCNFTSPPKEVVLQFFTALKIRCPWPGLNPRTLGPTASMHHQKRNSNFPMNMHPIQLYGIVPRVSILRKHSRQP